MRGRKPAPAPALNVVEGGFHPASEIVEPNWLLGFPKDWGKAAALIAAAQWAIVTAHMRAAGTLGPENAGEIEAYCVSWARWRLAEAHIAEHGPIVEAPRTGAPILNPMLRVARDAMEMVIKMAGDLGLPPAMRGRVTKAKRAEKTERPSDRYLKTVKSVSA